MVKHLDEAGIREMRTLKLRVKRLYGLDRITIEQHDELMEDFDGIEEKFRRFAEANDESETVKA